VAIGESSHGVLADLPGAVILEDTGTVDDGAVAHFGSPAREERALRSGRAFTDLSHVDVVRVSGPDRLEWLNSLTTQKLIELEPGISTETILLGPSGHIENAAAVIDDGAATWLITDAGFGAPFADFLSSMRFMKRVEVAPEPEIGAFGAMGEAAHVLADCAMLGADGRPLVWHDPWPNTAPNGATYGPRDAEHPGAQWDAHIALIPLSEQSAAVEKLRSGGIEAAGLLAWEAARVTAWRPRPAAEIVENVLPHELDWLRTAVHLHKGCYRGQEAVAKVVNMGKPPRRLAMLYLEGPVDELPHGGDDVVHEGRAVGIITSAVRDAVDGPVALALIRRSVPVEAVVEVGNFRAGQEAIVNPAGTSSATPATRPGAEFRRKLL
jgi:folate-binding protein YgfZ